MFLNSVLTVLIKTALSFIDRLWFIQGFSYPGFFLTQNKKQHACSRNHICLLPDYCTQVSNCIKQNMEIKQEQWFNIRNDGMRVSPVENLSLYLSPKSTYTHSVWNDLYNIFIPASHAKLQQCHQNAYIYTQGTCERAGWGVWVPVGPEAQYKTPDAQI